MAKVITFFNNKGGVGKTTSSVLLADYFEKKNKKILLIDLDPQSNLSRTFFNDIELLKSKSFYDFMQHGIVLNDIVLSYNTNIDIIPSSMQMDDVSAVDISYWLERLDEINDFFQNYEIVILDAPPSFNAFSRLAVLIANYIFIPAMADFYSQSGIGNVLKKVLTLKDINKNYIDYRAFISAHKNRKTIIAEENTEAFEEILKDKLLNNRLPEFVGLVERQETKTNIFDMYRSTDKQIERLLNFCNEINNYIKV